MKKELHLFNRLSYAKELLYQEGIDYYLL